jgi:hypothetical protein
MSEPKLSRWPGSPGDHFEPLGGGSYVLVLDPAGYRARSVGGGEPEPTPPTLPPLRPCPVCSRPMLDASEMARTAGAAIAACRAAGYLDALLTPLDDVNVPTLALACVEALEAIPDDPSPPIPWLDRAGLMACTGQLGVEQIVALGSALSSWSGVYCPACEGAERAKKGRSHG